MRRIRCLLAVVVALPLAVSAAGATPAPTAEVRASTIVVQTGTSGPGIESIAQPYSHYDCVGPGLPGTAGPHITHTENVTGFTFSSAVMRFTLTPLALFGSGICPTIVGGPVLPEDFTGTYRLTAVCRETSNDGTVLLVWEIQAVAGAVISQGSGGTSCTGNLGALFSLDITIAISPTSFLGIPLDPLGGILLTVTQ
ncbi:MAG: hypothetical protein HY775_07910 [Acidobacteria bacterium]|nr:hypothetical protein [Acidobacteriota bacterium]